MDSTEEIKSRLDIVDLVGEYLPLKPAGSGTFKACCPFHQEKTPSFFVSRARQSWHCFGCDIGGDHFSFVEKIEGMEFREALEHLAQKAGVELPAFNVQAASHKKRLQEVNEMATKFYTATLNQSPAAEKARDYLAKRGVDNLTADLFRLGYAPAEWSALSDALQKNSVTADELIKAGLSSPRQQGGPAQLAAGVYDRFRDRVMFPITDVHGHVIGFTARILDADKKEAKYINTPETAIYRKSAVLYGLDKAKGGMRREDLAVIVEGNMDVVGSHQFGVTNVAASSGTALTLEQLALLKRFTKNLAIAFDADAAGQAATVRGLDLARGQDFNIKIISLPPDAGKDPDDAVRKNPQIWKDAIKNAAGIMDWIYRSAFKNRHADKPEDKKLIAKEVLTEVRRIVDPVERDHWLKKLARDLDVSDQALREALGQSRPSAVRDASNVKFQNPNVKAQMSPAPAKDQHREQECQVLALLLSASSLFKIAAEELVFEPSELDQSDLSGLYTALLAGYHSAQPVNATSPPANLGAEQVRLFNYLWLLAEREFQGQANALLERELKAGIEGLRSGRKGKLRKELENQMREAERLGDGDRIAELLRQFESLNH